MAKKRCFLPLYLLRNQADGLVQGFATMTHVELFDVDMSKNAMNYKKTNGLGGMLGNTTARSQNPTKSRELLRAIIRYQSSLLVALLFAFATVSSGCGHPSAPAAVSAEKKQAAEGLPPVPESRDADDTARFLSGIPGKPGSPFADLEQTEAWKDHRARLDSAWHNADSSLVAGLQEFGKAELSDAALREATVFYPFSGPDALYATACFPNNATYVLVALEPSGTLPSLKQLSRKQDLGSYLAATRETMASVLGRSFFITREMDRQFRGQVTDGLLLPILEVLVRRHNTILGFRYTRLDDAGRLIERDRNYKPRTPYGDKGVQIEYRSDEDQSVHQMYYLTINLDDQHLMTNQPFVKYASGLKGAVTLLKATSYMTHRDEFSMIRDLVLANSLAVLQDDSGIPFHFFRPDTWKVQLYGAYTRPYGSFRYLIQSDLQKAYQDPAARPLPFRIGYGYGKVESNLQLARRTAQIAAQKRPAN